MNLKKQLRTHIKKANIPDVSKTIIDQLPYSNKNENHVFKKQSSFVLQFSAFLILLLGVSVFSYQQTSSQIYAFNEYEEVLGISAGVIDAYLEIEADSHAPMSVSLDTTKDIDVEIIYMLSYMRMVENIVLTQNKVIQNHRHEETKEQYVVTFDTIDQSQKSFEIEVEKSYQNFNQDVFEFQATFNNIDVTGYTEFNEKHHQLHLSASKNAQQLNIRYDNLENVFDISITKENQETIEFQYQLLRNNFDQPTLLLTYSRDLKNIDLTIIYSPIRRKVNVSYVISEDSIQSKGTFDISYMMQQGMMLFIKGETEDGDMFEYQFRRHHMFLNDIQ